jgi:hypothetical protein
MGKRKSILSGLRTLCLSKCDPRGSRIKPIWRCSKKSRNPKSEKQRGRGLKSRFSQSSQGELKGVSLRLRKEGYEEDFDEKS